MMIKNKTLIIILLFGFMFASIGWLAPAMYATYAPQEQFIEVDNFEASNATIADDSHILCLERTVHEPSPATLFTELYLINDNGETYEVDSRQNNEFFEQGTDTIKTPYTLPEKIEAGNYRYRLVLEMELAENRVTRSFAFHSNIFTVTDSDNKTSSSYNDYTC